MSVLVGRLAFARPYEVLHRSMLLMSSSLLLKQCPACLVRLTMIVFVMGGSWPYSCCFGGVITRTCSILLAVFLCNCRQSFSPSLNDSIDILLNERGINFPTSCRRFHKPLTFLKIKFRRNIPKFSRRSAWVKVSIFRLLKFWFNMIDQKTLWSYLPNPSARAGYDTRSIF